jgi:hypothetical protein
MFFLVDKKKPPTFELLNIQKTKKLNPKTLNLMSKTDQKKQVTPNTNRKK